MVGMGGDGRGVRGQYKGTLLHAALPRKHDYDGCTGDDDNCCGTGIVI